MKTVGAMHTEQTSKQFHIRIMIMKKFRQRFKIAIITTSDGFTQITINFANSKFSIKFRRRFNHAFNVFVENWRSNQRVQVKK